MIVNKLFQQPEAIAIALLVFTAISEIGLAKGPMPNIER